MRSREPYVARASEDERKETPTLLAARGFSTRRSYVTHAVTLIFPTDFRAKERLLAVYDKVEKTPIHLELSPVLNTFSNVLHLRITSLHNYILELGLNNKKNTHRCSFTCGSSLAAFHNMADLLSWGTLGNFVTHESSTRPSFSELKITRWKK